LSALLGPLGIAQLQTDLPRLWVLYVLLRFLLRSAENDPEPLLLFNLCNA
jgi:hypothetical protein